MHGMRETVLLITTPADRLDVILWTSLILVMTPYLSQLTFWAISRLLVLADSISVSSGQFPAKTIAKLDLL